YTSDGRLLPPRSGSTDIAAPCAIVPPGANTRVSPRHSHTNRGRRRRPAGLSGQITCQTRAVRSLVNNSEPTGEPVRGNEVRCLVQPGDSYKAGVSILWRHPPQEHDTTRGLRADDRGNPWQQRVGWASQ